MFWLIEIWKLIGKHVPRDGVALIGWRRGGSHGVEMWRHIDRDVVDHLHVTHSIVGA